MPALTSAQMAEEAAQIMTRVEQLSLRPEVESLIKAYQILHVKTIAYALKRRGIAVDLSDTGTGKTFTSMAVCKQLGLRPLIITPKSTIPNWYDVASSFDVEPLGVVNYETAKNSKYYSSLGDFYAEQRVECPYIEVIREVMPNCYTPAGNPKKRIREIKWKNLDPGTVIIFDEAQRGKNGIAQNAPMGSAATGTSKLLVSTKPYLDRTKGVFGMFLSATLTDGIECFDVISYILGLFRPYSKKAYLQYVYRLGGSGPAMEVLHNKIVPKYGARMSIAKIKEDTGDEVFKDCDVDAKAYPMAPNLAAQIEEQHQIIHTAMEELRNKTGGMNNPLVVMLRARQKIEMLKVSLFVELTEKYLRQGKYIVWFLNFKETKKVLTEKILEIPKNPGESSDDRLLTINDIDFIDGTNTAEEREQIRKAFQEDRIPVLICQIRAGGVGISLHDIIGDHPRVGLHSPTWSAVDMKQAIGRLYRSGAASNTKQRVIYTKPRVENPANPANPLAEPVEPSEPSEPMFGNNGQITYTIEESICKNINKKLRDISMLNDGDLEGHIDLV